MRSLAGHVSQQVMEKYSHLRSKVKQSAIQTLDQQAIPAPNLGHESYVFAYVSRDSNGSVEGNSHKTNGGPAWIRTRDQRIMSPLL